MKDKKYIALFLLINSSISIYIVSKLFNIDLTLYIAFLVLFSINILLIKKMFYSNQKYKHQSLVDGLTSLQNKRALNIELKKNNFKSLVMFDIDDFKLVNDKFDHIFGDEVLIEFSRILLTILPSKMKIYRFGGEEFLIISQLDISKTKKSVINVINEVRETLKDLNGEKITVSAGISEKTLDDYNFTLKDADANLYLAKHNGKNKVFMDCKCIYE